MDYKLKTVWHIKKESRRIAHYEIETETHIIRKGQVLSAELEKLEAARVELASFLASFNRG